MVDEVVLVRHGETEWSRDRRHTSRTDLALTEVGRREAEALRSRLAGYRFTLVLTSPMRRARETASICGFASAEITDALSEWDYGEVEGLTTAQVRAARDDPTWTIWRDDLVDGETLADVAGRVDRVIARIEPFDGAVALVGHAHCFRILTARWLGLDPGEGCRFVLATATLSRLGHEHGTRAVLSWNT